MILNSARRSPRIGFLTEPILGLVLETSIHSVVVVEVAVVGTGYVGLSTGACLAHLGHRVVCIDIDSVKVDTLRRGVVPIAEEGLTELVTEGLASGLLSFEVAEGPEVSGAEFVFLCLPTPQGEDGRADLRYLMDAVASVAPYLRSGSIVVNKSTVPVGTAVQVSRVLARADVSVVSNPEFLRQGSAVRDFLAPTRIVIGGDDETAVARVSGLYSKIEAPVLRMKAESAETLKYAANALLATKLTFINAVADICEVVGADIFDVAEGLALDPRIGPEMLRAGPGWGGSCFPKDTRALVGIAADHGYDFALLRGVIETNDSHYERIADKVTDACGGSVDGLVVAAWGLTFKAGTDDLRDSPAIKILSMLRDGGAKIKAFDPTARGSYQRHPWIDVCASPLEACTDADLLAVLTEWSDFRDVEPADVARLIVGRRVVDGRNILDRDRWIAAGFDYRGVGR